MSHSPIIRRDGVYIGNKASRYPGRFWVIRDLWDRIIGNKWHAVKKYPRNRQSTALRQVPWEELSAQVRIQHWLPKMDLHAKIRHFKGHINILKPCSALELCSINQEQPPHQWRRLQLTNSKNETRPLKRGITHYSPNTQHATAIRSIKPDGSWITQE